MQDNSKKNDLILYIKYQLNSFLSVFLRSSLIYIFSDILSYDYSTIFWITFILVSTNSFFIQKKFVFKSDDRNSLLRFVQIAILLGLLEYFISYYLLDFFNLNVFAFLIAGFGIYILRFLLNRYYVFGNNN